MERGKIQEICKDFFISYTKADREWAEWIAWQMEANGYTTTLQAWDFLPGSNFVLEMDKASKETKCTIAVLSPDYLSANYTQAEWTAAFRRDAKGEKGTLLPVRVQKCEVEGIMGPFVYIDLVSLDESAALEKLLAGARRERGKPEKPPGFPPASKPQRFPGTLPLIWNVPYSRNRFFTGRKDILEQLHEALTASRTATLTQPQAISGLGGIGKTQIALEYAYRYRQGYEAIFWLEAGTRDTLISDFVKIAELLNLSEAGLKEQMLVIRAVQQWLGTHTNWLLILDNADDLDLVHEFIPGTVNGSFLLTTKKQPLRGLAQPIKVGNLSPEQGALLLMRRAAKIAPDAPLEQASSSDDVASAKDLSVEMGGLPLALAQAGAYIEETEIFLSEYLSSYRKKPREFLGEGSQKIGYPESVIRTFSISFEKVQQEREGTVELLRLCSCLAPDKIPLTIITKGAPYLGQILQSLVEKEQLNAVIGTLLNYSLLSRDSTTNTLTIHRLLKDVLYEDMTPEDRQLWIKRAVQAMNSAFPETIETATAQQCQLLLPHVEAGISHPDDQELLFSEAAQLLNRAGAYLRKRAQYEEAQRFVDRALTINEQISRSHFVNTAHCYYTKARLSYDQGDYARAKDFYERSLKIQESFLGIEDTTLAETLLHLGRLYHVQGKYKEAEQSLLRALAIRQMEQADPRVQRETAYILHFLAETYRAQAKYQQAEENLDQALNIRRNPKNRGPRHPETARSLNDLGALYRDLARYQEAEERFLEAIDIRQEVLGPEHPDTAVSYHSLARLYYLRKNYKQAEDYANYALAIREKLLDANHPRIAQSYCDLAAIRSAQGFYKEAEEYLQSALAIYTSKFGKEHPDVATCQNDLAALYIGWERKFEEAKELEQAARAIYERVFDPEHPRIAASLTIRARLLELEGNYLQAEPLYQRALAIYEQVLGPNHPTTIIIRNNYTTLRQHLRRQT